MVTVKKKSASAPRVDRNAGELTGTVEEIVYQNKLNDYTVLELGTDEGELVTAVGQMPYVGEVGGWLFEQLGIQWGGLLGQLGTATVGAVAILWVASLIKK